MSDLQDAFDWVDSGPTVVGAKHINALADAARKYANPDYEFAAIIQHNRNMYEPVWVVWADLSEGDRANRIKQAKIDVDAALNVTEDE